MRFRRGSGREITRRNRVNQVSPIKSELRKSLQFGGGGTTECSPVLLMICPVCQGPHSKTWLDVLRQRMQQAFDVRFWLLKAVSEA